MAKKVLTGKDNTNGFQKNPQNINRKGQPRKGVNLILHQMKERGIEPITKGQVEDIIMNLMNMEDDDMKSMEADPKTPAIVKIILKEMADNNKGFNAINSLLDRSIGKAIQKTEVSGKDGNPIQIMMPSNDR